MPPPPPNTHLLGLRALVGLVLVQNWLLICEQSRLAELSFKAGLETEDQVS